MTGLILDAVLMLLLVAALAYGMRLEKKLSALRAGQLAFAGAVTELNAAAGRAENALASLRTSGEEADMLHDRILKARALKTELETLISRGRPAAMTPRPIEVEAPVEVAVPAPAEERALRMAALAERFQPRAASAPRPAAPTPVFQALAANHAAQQSLNRARRSMDEDLFAA